MADGLDWTPLSDSVDLRAFQMGRLGPYQLGPQRRLTRFGRVLAALHPHFYGLVELELLERLPQAATQDLEGAFMLELAHALGLEHKHIATTVGAGLYEGVAYVAQPLVLGHTLAELHERSPSTAASLMPGILHAVAAGADFLLEAGPFPSACSLGGFDARDIILGYDGSVRLTGYGMSRFRKPVSSCRREDLESARALAEHLDPNLEELVAPANDLADMQTILRKNFREELAQRGSLIGRSLRREFAEEVAKACELYGIGAMH